MNVDIEKACAQCGRRYWWTVREQEDFARRRLRSPKRCPDCRAARKRAPAHQTQALVRREPSSKAMILPELQQPLITGDIRRLIAEASAPVENRRRTVSEWWNNEDPREKQLVKKIQARRTAIVLVKQQTEFMASLSELAKQADDFRRERLEAQLAELELRDRIAERLSLRSGRLATQRAIESETHCKLLEAEAAPEPVSRSQQIVGEHREELQARAAAQRAALADFRSEVAAIIAEDVDDGQKAHELRAVLESYRLPENALPKRVRQFLADVDGEDEP